VLGAPSLAVGPGGHVVLAWVTTTGVVQAAVWAGGWQAPVDLGGGAVPDVDVAVAASGDAAAVWSVRRGAEVVVQAAFRPGASGWMPAVDVAATGRAGPAVPHVVLDPAGNADAVWIGGGEPPVVQGSKRSRASSTWSPAVAISARGREPIDAPQLAVDPAGNAVVAWTDPDGMTLAAIRPSAGPWQPPSELSAVPTGGVRLAMGPVGVALAVWSRFEPRRIRVEASELGGIGPVLASLTVPTTGIAARAVEFSVRPLPWAATLSGEPTWSFGDGAIAAGATVRHAFARPGRYTVSVTQADVAGGTSTLTGGIVIAAAAPANTLRPFVRGPRRAGSMLVCNRGVWAGTPPIRFAYAWLRNGRSIPGAHRSRYRVALRDRGRLLSCRVTATNAGGSRSARARPVRIQS
jgi:hypothetical protein